MADFPKNFVLLHDGEEVVRRKSIESIEKNPDLSLHASIAQLAANKIHYFIHRNKHCDDDDLAIRLLGIRLFNGINTTLSLLLAGYYQSSTLQQRDVIETMFLLDYFSLNRSLVQAWRQADDKTLKANFSPAAVRKAIVTRDGFSEKKRESSYKLFSTIAGHPHPKGFVMLRLPNGDHHCGPFYETSALIATLSELGRTALQAGGIFGKFFDAETKADFEVSLAFLEAQREWLKRFYDQEYLGDSQINEMKELLAKQ